MRTPWRAAILAAACLAIAGGKLSANGQASGVDYVTVQWATVTPLLDAYGQVEPITVAPVSAAQAGVIAGLRVLPGMHVRAGAALAHLNGPEITSLLLQSQADLRSAQAQLSASQKSLAIQRQQLLLHLSTRQAVHQAESAAAQAQTAFENAQSRLKAVHQMTLLTAPASGTVLAVNATDGELVSAGQSVLTLQTTGRLWLKASYYGADTSAIHVGMRGSFSPAEGGVAIPVKVSAVFGSFGAGGGTSIAMTPVTAKSRWINGEFGTVALDSPSRRLIAVPTRALIVDGGKWWVMVHTAQGDRPQAVVPGPVRGWQTFIQQGLDPGAQVIVGNAYLLFHRGISRSYQTPD